MTVTLASLAFAIAALASSTAFADGTTPLTHDELQQLMPGAQVQITYADGSTTLWKDADDGSVEAVWTSGFTSSKHYSAPGTGTWKISDDGKYCSHVQWRRNVSDWCSPVVKGDDGEFALANHPDWKMKVSK
ncbi:DUF995 domain-containing protein [Paraburkholderia bannensis]|uniref:DUF995 domain-containing protein n=1 Tax=Paraburkholderia bannensis TaxID=765414 RepID=UPI002AB72AB5|nr:DUF995 domain-containing protein [Paraburkholderia bannensis]